MLYFIAAALRVVQIVHPFQIQLFGSFVADGDKTDLGQGAFFPIVVVCGDSDKQLHGGFGFACIQHAVSRQRQAVASAMADQVSYPRAALL